MQSWMVRSALIGLSRAQAAHRRRLDMASSVEVEDVTPTQAEGRSGMEDEEHEEKEEGDGRIAVRVLTTRRTQLADSERVISPQC